MLALKYLKLAQTQNVVSSKTIFHQGLVDKTNIQL